MEAIGVVTHFESFVNQLVMDRRHGGKISEDLIQVSRILQEI